MRFILEMSQHWIPNSAKKKNKHVAAVAQRLKHLPTMQETWVQSPGWKIPWRRKWQPTPVFFLGESHGRRSLVGYSLWCCKESDTAEQLHFHYVD